LPDKVAFNAKIKSLCLIFLSIASTIYNAFILLLKIIIKL